MNYLEIFGTFIGIIYLWLEYRASIYLWLAGIIMPATMFVSNLNWLDPQITPLVPVLKSYWLMIHVSVVTASYGFFGICAACGIASLAATAFGRNLRELRAINEMAMIVGLALLTAGIFFGAVWANESWGRYWGWDPKETWALITMFAYALATHSRHIPRLDGPFAGFGYEYLLTARQLAFGKVADLHRIK